MFRKLLVALGFKRDENSCLLGKNHVCDHPLKPRPPSSHPLFGRYVVLRHLFNVAKTDADGFTMQVH